MQQKLELASLDYTIHWLDANAMKKEFSNLLQSRNFAKSSQHFVITSDNIYSLYKEFLHETFSNATILQVADGESSKSMATVENLCSELLQAGADRHSVLWAFGGGVIGDITGFTASVYMRGIRFVQVPTTLLAMVDSSVGGKTGVNLALPNKANGNATKNMAKNMIGSFYQPQAVFIAIDFLKTLPQREMICGLAEAVKSALLDNAEYLQKPEEQDFFSYLESHSQEINARQAKSLYRLSSESVRIKAKVVEQDEKESNLRAILNLGHTLAHALESFFSNDNDEKIIAGGNINHGEAVSIGLHFAVFVSVHESDLSESQAQRIIDLLKKLQMPLFLQDVKSLATDSRTRESEKNKENFVSKLVDLMRKDKKNKRGEIYFVLLSNIGSYVLPKPIEAEKLKNYLVEFLP